VSTIVKRVIVFMIVFLLTAGLIYVGALLDLWLNPWLKTVRGFQWWNYFTTRHALTILYLHNYQLFITITIILAFIVAFVVTLVLSKD